MLQIRNWFQGPPGLAQFAGCLAAGKSSHPLQIYNSKFPSWFSTSESACLSTPMQSAQVPGPGLPQDTNRPPPE